MSSLLTCAAGAWIPFADPTSEENKVYEVMKDRIANEDLYKNLNANEYEMKESNLRRIIRESFYDVEVALNTWLSWVEYRHTNKADEITDDEVKHELTEGIFAWRGKNKENMNCCVITGRMFKPQERKGSSNSFKRFVLKTVEDGMKTADASGVQDKVCIIYDRRGLEYDHIDPNMYQFCKRLLNQMQDFYRNRIGMIYVIHTNVIYWLLYTLILRPLLGLLTGGDKIICVESPQELLEYFDEEQLLLLSYAEPTETSSEAGTTDSGPSAGTVAQFDEESGPAGEAAGSESAIKDVVYSDNIGAMITKHDKESFSKEHETIHR